MSWTRDRCAASGMFVRTTRSNPDKAVADRMRCPYCGREWKANEGEQLLRGGTLRIHKAEGELR